MAQNPPLFYSIMVILLLINGHTQGRPAAPQLPFGSLSPTAQPQGCDIYGDRVYLPGEVISGDPNGCFAVICTEHGIQIWDGDCQSSTANPKPPSSAPATFEVELTTERPPPTFPIFPFAGVQGWRGLISIVWRVRLGTRNIVAYWLGSIVSGEIL